MPERFEGREILARLSTAEQERVGIIVDAAKRYPILGERIEVYIGGKVRRGAISHHITLAVKFPMDVEEAPGPDFLSYIESTLETAGLGFERDPAKIGQPRFVGWNELFSSPG